MATKTFLETDRVYEDKTFNTAYKAVMNAKLSTMDNVLVTGITVSGSATLTGAVGTTSTYTATVTPTTATTKTVTWSSSNVSAATINATTGEASIVADGETTITATATDGSGKVGTFNVTVDATA